MIKSGTPFRRALMLLAGIAEVMKVEPTPGVGQRLLLDALGPYESRGKGGRGRRMQRTILGRWSQDRSKYNPKLCALEGKR